MVQAYLERYNTMKLIEPFIILVIKICDNSCIYYLLFTGKILTFFITYDFLTLTKVAFETVSTILWKSDKPLSTTSQLWKYYGKSVKYKSIKDGFAGFLLQVRLLIKPVRLYLTVNKTNKLQKASVL